MTISPITAEDLIAAFALPPGPPPRRVAKSTLADFVPTASDKRLVDSKLARLEWMAAINPDTTGISAAESGGLAIQTVNLLLARTRGALPPRLAEIIHRAIPQPVILVHSDEGTDASAGFSLAPKRAAEREAGRVVVTALHDTGALELGDEPFLATLALPRLPARDLAALYAGLVERVEALAAARRRKRPFRLPTSEQELGRWRDAVLRCTALEGEIAVLVSAMRKETRLARRVEMGEVVRKLKASLDKCLSNLD